ncbi:hypothetical protein R4I97_00005 [Brachyspira pilosicoli]|uniref:hypothetical protein n=1 Tax=Brachyspira pilosicoli TaxID=52584 RepID=UPI00300694FD
MENKDLIANSLSEQLKEANKTLPDISNYFLQSVNSDLLKSASCSISNAISNVMELHKKEYKKIMGVNVINSFHDALKQYEKLYKKEYKKIMGFNVINSFHDALKQYEELSKNIPELNYKKVFSDSIDKVFLKLEEDENVNLKDIDKNEIEEFKNDLYEINKENVVLLNRQQKLFDVYKKWAYKNPIIAAILIFLFTTIVGFYLTILLPVRKNANSNSQIINQTTINNITIIDEVKYYYKVQTIDNEGNIINGYVTKRKYNKLKSNKTVEK